MNKLKSILAVLTTPSVWLQNYRFSSGWDARLNELMRDHKFVAVDRYTVSIGEVVVWVENHPYASFRPYGNRLMDVRPSRFTILRAWEKLQRELFLEPQGKA